MGWLSKKLYKLVEKGKREVEDEYKDTVEMVPYISNTKTNTKAGKLRRGMSFNNPTDITLYRAVGGHIVKFSKYDKQRDDMVETVYIISDDEDFDQALAHLITLEALKHG